jgi:predicted acyl esterase
VPLFLTQGLTENNTVSDGTAQYLTNHTGYERAWLGPWDHVRGNQTDDTGRLLMGRAGWFDEVMRFYDRFLKGVKPTVRDPRIAVQTNDGKWRAEASWPPADASGYTSDLLPGTYSDDGSGSITDPDGVWTISPPLPYDVHLSGSGQVNLDVSSPAPRSNLVVDVYDLDAHGTGPLITRQGHLIYTSGQVALDLWSADWKIPAGHRIAVRVTDANSDWWEHVPTMRDVTVHGGSITLPFLRRQRTQTIQGDPGTQLEGYLKDNAVTVPPQTIASSESESFALPPQQSSKRTTKKKRHRGR